MKILNYFLIITIIFLVFYIYKSHSTNRYESFINKKKNSFLKLYQILYDTDKIMNKNNITYWIDGGTTLGAVRHKGIIPWDDDVDISILDKDVSKITNKHFIKQLNELGYDLTTFKYGYKIFYKNGKKIRNYSWRFPFLDIFIYKKRGDKIVLDVKNNPWKKCYYKINDLFPLKRYQFGIFKVYGPNKTKNYLDRCYGDNWNKVKYQTYDHSEEKRVKKIIKPITNEDRKPAMPMSPIKF